MIRLNSPTIAKQISHMKPFPANRGLFFEFIPYQLPVTKCSSKLIQYGIEKHDMPTASYNSSNKREQQ
jgi:hypothetical protein